MGKIWYMSDYHEELVDLRFIISIVKRYHKPLSFRVHKGSNNEGFIFRQRPQVPGQTVKLGRVRQPNLPELRGDGYTPNLQTAKNRYSYNRISLHEGRDLVQVITLSR